MDLPSKTRLNLTATLVALPAALFGLSGQSALAGDFVNLSAVGAATSPDLVYLPVSGPWTEPSFQQQFPDLVVLREVRVDLLPLVEPEPGTAGPAGVSGAKRRGPIATPNIRPPKITIKVRP